MSSGFKELVTIAIEHSENWGMVWFGLIFWGSVLNALIPLYFSSMLGGQGTVSAFAVGLAVGIAAKVRGGWLWKN